MAKDVLITVLGTQTNEWGDEDSIELITTGKYYLRNDSYYIIYRESAISGMEGSTTSLKVEKERVILNRMGQSAHKQVFQKGMLNEGNYVTPYGNLWMGVIPSRVDINLTELGGSINLEYELEVGREKISNNQLSITVREV